MRHRTRDAPASLLNPCSRATRITGSGSDLVDRTKMVFGVPLPLAVRISRVSPDLDLPAIVQQCITYLNAEGKPSAP